MEVQYVMLTSSVHCKGKRVPGQQRVTPCCKALQHCPMSPTAIQQAAGLPAVCDAPQQCTAWPALRTTHPPEKLSRNGFADALAAARDHH